MSASPELINRVVDGVLKALSQNTRAPENRTSNESRTASSRADKQLCLIDQRVLTESDLMERFAGHDSLRIAERCVLTPTALDFIRRHRLRVQRTAPATRSPHSPSVQLILQNPLPGLDPKSLGPSELAGCVALSVGAALSENVDQARSMLCRGECDLVVITTPTPYAAVCLANRHESIRACFVPTLEAIVRATAELSPTVLVIDEHGLTRFGLVNLLRQFLRQPRPATTKTTTGATQCELPRSSAK